MKTLKQKKDDKARKLTIKDYSLRNGKFLDSDIIHCKGANFIGNIFK